GGGLGEELVRRLDEDAGAVAGVLLAAAGAAVLQVVEDGQGPAHDGVRPAPLQVDDEADAAGVVLVGRVVEPLPAGRERVAHDGQSFPGARAARRPFPLVVPPAPLPACGSSAGPAWPRSRSTKRRAAAP